MPNSNRRNEILYLMVFPNYKLGNYQKAIDLLTEILDSQTPESLAGNEIYGYINGLGELLITTSQYEEFVSYISKFLNSVEKDIKSLPLDILIKYGECLFKLKKTDLADAAFEIILSHNITQVTDLVRAIGMMYETENDFKTSLKYYQILVNTLLTQNKDEQSDDEEEDKVEEQPQPPVQIPPEVEFDILKCSLLYKKLNNESQAEQTLLRGLKALPKSFEIRKELSEIYRSKGDIEAAISITNQDNSFPKKSKSGNHKSDSDYDPSEDGVNEDSDLEAESDLDEIEGENIRTRKHRREFTSDRALRRFKNKEGQINSTNITENLEKSKKRIYEEYNHGSLILDFERSKALYESKSYEEFINVFTPTLERMILRQLEVKEYSYLLHKNHMIKYSEIQETNKAEENKEEPQPQELFFQNKNMYKKLEAERVKKEKKVHLENLLAEIDSLPNLFSELDEKVIEDILYKLLLEILRSSKYSILTEEFIGNLWTLKSFNRYPESPKVLMIYIVLFKIFCKRASHKEAYRVMKRLCRNYPNSSLFWSSFAQTCHHLTKEEELEDQERTHTVFSYRGYIHRMIQRYVEKEDEDLSQECRSLLHMLQGNNYLHSLCYEKAVASYTKAIELIGSKLENPLIYFLLSKTYLQWCTSRTNFQKEKTMLSSFKYLKMYQVARESTQGAVKVNKQALDLESMYNTGRNFQFLNYNTEAYLQYKSVLNNLQNITAEGNELSLPDLNTISQVKVLTAYNLSILYKNKGCPEPNAKESQLILHKNIIF